MTPLRHAILSGLPEGVSLSVRSIIGLLAGYDWLPQGRHTPGRASVVACLNLMERRGLVVGHDGPGGLWRSTDAGRDYLARDNKGHV